MRLWSAQGISAIGGQMTILALPLTAVLVLQASAFEVALLATAASVPYLVLGIPVGVWVDRVRRRPVMIAADVGRAARARLAARSVRGWSLDSSPSVRSSCRERLALGLL